MEEGVRGLGIPMIPAEEASLSRRFAPFFVLIAASLLLSIPLIRFGLPFGMDAAEHLSWYRCFAQQLWSGEVYPRWLLGMNGGLGSPDFFVYGPLPYYVAAVFRVLTLAPGRESAELGISLWLALLISGVAAYIWLKDLVGGIWAPAIGALVYMATPYHIKTDLYTRTALAELWAFAWLPFLLYFARRAVRRRTVSALRGFGIAYALLLVTHLFTALMFSPVPLLYAWFLSGPRRRVRAVTELVLSMLFGAALASFYLLPALAYQKYISPYKLIETRPDYLYYRNFLFLPGSDAFLRSLSWLTAWTAAVAAGFFLIALLSSIKHNVISNCASAVGVGHARPLPGSRTAPPTSAPCANNNDAMFRDRLRESVYWSSLAALSVFMMLPVSGAIWKMLPPLQAIQFPSRLNVLLTLAVAALAALAVDGLRRIHDWRTTVLAAGTFLLVAGWSFPIARSMGYQSPWIAAKGAVNLDYLITAWAQWTDPKLISLRGIPLSESEAQVAVDGGSAVVQQWQARAIVFRIAEDAASWVAVRQFYFPGWIARDPDGRSLAVRASSPQGLVEIRVPAGETEVRLSMPYGISEITGAVVSAVAILGLLLSWLFNRPARRLA